ncbi:MAG: serine/threonine-protein kinase [Acidobacteriota bacterium]
MSSVNTSRCRLCSKMLPGDPSQDGLCPQCRSSLPVEDAPPTADEAAIANPDASSARDLPEHIGPYKVLDFLGEGGMGVVYLAEREQPIRRKVALKVIKLGMDTKEVIARFESERQALAMMNHPNIAQVHDAGTTDRGAPYFVMEYVAGVPIADYCDRHRLSTRERLEIFIPVCQAVQHAHQKGIIHRDIKPSNILVALQDGKPVPKIIDFGVAKATHQRLTEKTVFTQQGYLIGTPEYMSPEQAEMTGLDVDTTTDIYSLGVLLYELLVGALPFDPRALRRAGFDEIRRIIREVDPPKPTTRLSSLGQLAKGIAERRHTDVVSLAKELRGDIDWITLKAMEKDRTQRYASSSELAADIERHLRNEPVIACPPSSAYRLRKFVRRHRIGVAAIVTIVLLIAGFTVATAVQARRIARERDRANHEAARANLEAAAAVQVADFLTSLFRVSDPAEARGRPVTAREVLDKGAARIMTDLARDPILQARLLFTMGDVYRNLGVLDRAEQLLEQSVSLRRQVLGPDAPDTLRASSLLGSVYDNDGKTEIAEKLLTSTLATERRVLGEDHPNTLKTLVNLANLYDSQGRYEKSVPMMQDVFERRRKVLGADHLDTLGSQYNLAIARKREHRLPEAERLLVEVAASFARVAGTDHPNTLLAKDLLANIYLEMDRPRDARRILEEVYEARVRVLGPEHMDTLATKLGLATTAMEEERFAEAEPLFRDTLAAQERTLGLAHPDTIATRASLATMLSHAGRFAEAERLWRDTLARMKRILGAGHPDTANCYVGLAEIEMHRSHRDATLRLLRQAVRVNPVWGAKLGANPAFAPLKGNPEFQRLVASAKQK